MGDDFYIYCYFRPTGEPCYIGKGRGRRWKHHLKQSTNPRLRNIIAKAGGDVPHVKLHVGLLNDQANEYEIALIKAIGRGKNGPLVNMTDGGEGVLGPRGPMSQEHKLKIGAAQRGKTRPPISDETRAKLRASRLGKKRGPMSTEQKHKLSLSHMGMTNHKGFKVSAQSRAKMSESARNRKPRITLAR